MIQRTFTLGSNWIYIKLYMGENMVDNILTKAIHPILNSLQKNQHIEKWFFIRYLDSAFHLRIRIFIKDTKYIGDIILLFNKKLNKYINNHMVWKVQFDTYNRELERYGHNLMEESESMFFFDSECILSILRTLTNNSNYRWMITLKLIDELLSAFNTRIEEKREIMEEISQYLKKEFKIEGSYLKQFNTKYRNNRVLIEAALDNTFLEKEFNTLCFLVKKRTKQLIPIVQLINSKSKNKSEKNKLLKSYIHMTINRISISNNRIHEMILADFMSRYYSCKIAKSKYNK